MKIRLGYEIVYDCPQPTPMILALSVHYTRISDLIVPDHVLADPPVPITAYRDSFGNWCSRIVAPKGELHLSTDALVNDTGLPDVIATQARQTPVEDLPDETLLFLLGSRYCETDRLSEIAWSLFGEYARRMGARAGDLRLRPSSHHVRLRACPLHARRRGRPFTTGPGVCRDYAHLADRVLPLHEHPGALLHRLPGRHRHPAADGPMDFAAWFEAYLDGHWYTFDARNNTPRIGRVLIARGRDAADVAITTTFGPNTLQRFVVRTDEVIEEERSPPMA